MAFLPCKLRLPFTYTLIGAVKKTGHQTIVAIERAEAPRYITYRANDDGSCYLGHYLPTWDDAIRDMHARFV